MRFYCFGNEEDWGVWSLKPSQTLHLPILEWSEQLGHNRAKERSISNHHSSLKVLNNHALVYQLVQSVLDTFFVEMKISFNSPQTSHTMIHFHPLHSHKHDSRIPTSLNHTFITSPPDKINHQSYCTSFQKTNVYEIHQGYRAQQDFNLTKGPIKPQNQLKIATNHQKDTIENPTKPTKPPPPPPPSPSPSPPASPLPSPPLYLHLFHLFLPFRPYDPLPSPPFFQSLSSTALTFFSINPAPHTPVSHSPLHCQPQPPSAGPAG